MATLPDTSDFRFKLYSSYVSRFKADHRKNGRTDRLKHSPWYAFSEEAWYKYKYMPLLKDIPLDTPILELGCGTGDMMAFLKRQQFSNVCGIDVAAEQVAIAKSRGLNVTQGDVFNFLSANTETFGLIVALDFIEHFTREELLELIPLLYKRLKKGGRLLLKTPNGRGLFPNQVVYGDLTHMTIFTPQSLKQLLRYADFQKFTFVETGPTPTYPLGVVRLAAWKLVKLGANLVRQIEKGKNQKLWTENMICSCCKE